VKENKYVYLFKEGKADMKALLGGKGANLAEMTNIGLPVPPGLTITTRACIQFYEANKQFPPGMEEQLWEKLAVVEEQTGKKFGDPKKPAAGVCTVRRSRFDAGYDGYHPQPGLER